MLEQKGFSKAQSYWVGIPSILESLYAEQIAQDRPLLSLSLGEIAVQVPAKSKAHIDTAVLIHILEFYIAETKTQVVVRLFLLGAHGRADRQDRKQQQ